MKNLTEIGVMNVRVLDASGAVIDRRDGLEMHSYNRNILAVWLGHYIGQSQTIYTAAGGTASSSDACFDSATANVAKGIVIGTGSTATQFDDIALETLILNGSTSGRMTWDVQSISIALSSGVATNTIIRTFTNNSGGSIGVNEIGVYGSTAYGTSTTNQFMLLREVLGSTATVPDAGQLVVELVLAYNSTGSLNRNGAHLLARRWNNSTTSGSTSTLTGMRRLSDGGSYGTSTSLKVYCLGDETMDNRGILVGTDATAFDPDASVQYDLLGRIGLGTGAGQLVFGATGYGAIESDTSDGTFTIFRSFVNNSGGSITVREVGLSGCYTNSSSTDANHFLLVRKVLDTPVVIADGDGVQFKFVFSASN